MTRLLALCGLTLALTAAAPSFGLLVAAVALVGVTFAVAMVIVSLAASLADDENRGRVAGDQAAGSIKVVLRPSMQGVAPLPRGRRGRWKSGRSGPEGTRRRGRPVGRVDGKVVLISGGARGMGASHARHLVEEGAAVVVGDVLDASDLVAELGERARAVHLDVTEPTAWTTAVETAVTEFGGLDVLVNNAGIVNVGAIGDYGHEDWRRIIDVNLTGVFNGITAATEALKRSGHRASIVNISSTAGLKGYEIAPGYTASKWGVRGLTKAVAIDLGRYGVRCNSVHPGVIRTPMTVGWPLDTHLVPLHRIGEPDEVSRLVVYLASDESSFSTGAEFVVDGGETAGLAPLPE